MVSIVQEEITAEHGKSTTKVGINDYQIQNNNEILHFWKLQVSIIILS